MYKQSSPRKSLLLSSVVLFSLMPSCGFSAETEVDASYWIQSAQANCLSSITSSENKDCTTAATSLSKANSTLSSWQSNADALALYEQAKKALLTCILSKPENEKTGGESAAAKSSNAPGSRRNNGNSNSAPACKEGYSWNVKCGSALTEGKIRKQCKNGRVVVLSDTCKALTETCGTHENGTTWIDSNCPAGTVGSLKYQCTMGVKKQIRDGEHLCRETQCTLPDGSKMAVGARSSRNCGDVRGMFFGTSTYLNYNGNLGVASISCKNFGAEARIFVDGQLCHN